MQAAGFYFLTLIFKLKDVCAATNAFAQTSAVTGSQNGGPEVTQHDLNLAILARELVTRNTETPVFSPRIGEDTVLLRGVLNSVRLRPGLIMHASDVTELRDVDVRTEVQSGVSFLYFSYGKVDVRFGETDFHMGTGISGGTGDDANAPPRGEPRAFIVNRAEPDVFSRKIRTGTRIRKLLITVTPEWLDAGGLSSVSGPNSLHWLLNEHLSSFAFIPSPRLQSLVEHIIDPPAMPEAVRNLYLESRAIDVVAEMIASAVPDHDDQTILGRIERLNLDAALEFIDANPEQVLSIEEIARHVGISASSLQRLFKKGRGCSVFDHVRQRRMEKALKALQTSSIPIAQAAHIAGYSSPANFATAFRKMFGVVPSQVRDRYSLPDV